MFTVLAYIHYAILPGLAPFGKEYAVRDANIPKILVVVDDWKPGVIISLAGRKPITHAG